MKLKGETASTPIRRPIAGYVAMVLLALGVASLSAFDGRNGRLHVIKNCANFTGAAGSYCTIATSNVPEIKAGSKIYYTQAAGVPAGLLDSNVVLDAGNGNRTVGRCTLDLTTGEGLCTLSDGTGYFAGFKATIDVSSAGGADYRWDGTYKVSREGDR